MNARLSDAAIRDIAESFTDFELHRSDAQHKPTAVLIVGQEGAGKGALASELADRFVASGYVPIEAESLRPLLPYYEAVQQDERLDQLTQADTQRLSDEIRRIGMDARRNLIVESSQDSSDRWLATANELRQAGYKVELHAIAVNDQISFVRAATQHEAALEAGDDVPPLSKQAHDQGFTNASAAVRRLEFAAAVDNITVYNRLNDPILNRAPIAGSVAAGAEFDRARGQLTEFERINLAEKWTAIEDTMASRGASEQEWNRIRPSVDRAHYHLQASPAAAQSFSFDHPEEAFRSQSMAARYGARLELAFRADRRDQVAELPELATAFTNQAAALRHVENAAAPFQQRFREQLVDNIAGGLRVGTELREAGVRDRAMAQVAEAAAER